ncbi:hypothetical protein [Spirillospora sp. NPDC029432]|uniref:hypothetical protein n=1 Tax=Spirillospora sp. NPDC029432 TaxID=3154599 RepID=UPI0034565830
MVIRARILVPAAVAAVLSAAVAGALGAAAAGPISRPVAPARCALSCPPGQQPVTCAFDNGRTAAFAGACLARAYACRHGLEIVGCAPGQVRAA